MVRRNNLQAKSQAGWPQSFAGIFQGLILAQNRRLP